MSKQDVLKVQTCILKVDIRCACKGCEDTVRKRLQKVDGVYSVSVDAEQGKVIVTGNNVDPDKLIHKLKSSGKHAELWGGAAQEGKNMITYDQSLPTNQPNNLRIENNKKSQNKGGGGGDHVPVQMKGEGGNSKQKPGGDKKESKSGGGGGGLIRRFLGLGEKGKKRGEEADKNMKNGGGGGEESKKGAEEADKNMKNGGGGGEESKKGAGEADKNMKNGGGGGKGNNKGKEGKMGGEGKLEGHDFDIPAEARGGKGGKRKNGNGGDGPMGQMGPMSQRVPMGPIPAGDYPGMQVPAPQYNPQQQYMGMMMNQQQAAANMNNDRLYPESQSQEMYGRPHTYMGYMPHPSMEYMGHPSMGYMPPPPMPSQTMANPVTHVFSDDNTESCSIM